MQKTVWLTQNTTDAIARYAKTHRDDDDQPMSTSAVIRRAIRIMTQIDDDLARSIIEKQNDATNVRKTP